MGGGEPSGCVRGESGLFADGAGGLGAAHDADVADDSPATEVRSLVGVDEVNFETPVSRARLADVEVAAMGAGVIYIEDG